MEIEQTLDRVRCLQVCPYEDLRCAQICDRAASVGARHRGLPFYVPFNQAHCSSQWLPAVLPGDTPGAPLLGQYDGWWRNSLLDERLYETFRARQIALNGQPVYF